MSESLEREVKIRFASAAEARAAVAGIGAVPLRALRLQDDRLLDTADGRLRDERCTLRVRQERWPEQDHPAGATVTFKGPPRPDVMKVREEIETGVDDGALLLQVLERAGFRVWFRYQKHREEFTCDGAVVAIDETPCGVFVEIEGAEGGVAQVARALGRTPGDYVVDSYRTLYEADCARRGRPVADMVFE
ncbi:MAG: class IV adenylate cyclase [Acidobacteria bacterium]|nr:class IV adenylate cyclase [Acidobacteriota bacterium]